MDIRQQSQRAAASEYGAWREGSSAQKIKPNRNRSQRNEMVRGSIKLLKDAAGFCEDTNSLIGDALGVSFPLSSKSNFEAAIEFFIKDGIPCLVPTDGKTLEADDTLKPEDAVKSSVEREADQGGSH
ncbi:unnamed protein product [Prunus armeniaca]|uniref:Uncharacterized protein n=1 Tax=Prunus armeniaca TaxID=36596 RepID=A0A6J5Y405_PRUAR|nr:unnamed protein product [Prunus armeniaca]